MKEISNNNVEFLNNNYVNKIHKSSKSVYNVDDDATHELHKIVDIGLIFKSLNLSPIHWKCIPQLKGIQSKHISAVCGVIIKKKKKKSKSLKGLTFKNKDLSE